MVKEKMKTMRPLRFPAKKERTVRITRVRIPLMIGYSFA